MYIRKQNVFTERRIFPYATEADLRMDLIPKVRKLAVNNAGGRHPWGEMDDKELLVSAGLYGTDMTTGQRGYNLAAILLLGKDDAIMSACPTYVTDALLRKVDIDRYDDREIVKTNLIESYDILMEFARKHLPDKFFIEGINRISLRNIIAREMISNTLMHREFTSSYVAKFVIEKDWMYIENANRSSGVRFITPDNLEPYSKNPVIASFFRNIGYADNLGSGTRKLFKYSKLYSGKDPEFKESDIFRISVPLNEIGLIDTDGNNILGEINGGINTESGEINGEINIENEKIKLSEMELKVLTAIKKDSHVRRSDLLISLNIGKGTLDRALKKLKEVNLIERVGSNKTGYWKVN